MERALYHMIVAWAFFAFLGPWAMLPSALHGSAISLGDLSYEDKDYLTLSESTVASKNRMIKKTRISGYSPPAIYRYNLKPYEDIWTIIAKTSLNIDSIATLNRFDFIGMVRQGEEVFLPDTLGLFFEPQGEDTAELSRRFGVREEDILTVDDPFTQENRLLFIPEVELTFLERSYLTGVVFHSPLSGMQSSGYGARVDPFVNDMTFHGGVDIASIEGKFVRASRWGTVTYAGEQNGYGKLVILRHELGYHTFYGHLQEILVTVEENVETGQAIGRVGSTGRTTAPHLHFEIRRMGKRLNPENIPFLLEHR